MVFQILIAEREKIIVVVGRHKRNAHFQTLGKVIVLIHPEIEPLELIGLDSVLVAVI